MSTFPQVTSALKTHLDAISTTKVKTVLKGFNRANTGFPFVRFYFDGPTSQQESAGGGAASNYRTAVDYIVEIVGELSSDKVASKKEDDLIEASEAVVAKLEEEWKLNSSDVITDIVSQGSRAEQLAEGYMRVIVFRVTVQTFRKYV